MQKKVWTAPKLKIVSLVEITKADGNDVSDGNANAALS
jgi:hypothetical protein